MEGTKGQGFHCLSEEVFKSLLHFPGGLIGKGNCYDVMGAYTARFNQISNSMSNNLGLATTRPSQYQYGTFNSLHGLSLGRIKRS
jgi:hypothetical protein